MFRPTNSARAAQNRAAYIPPHMQQAMAKHMEQTMPAHLQKYQGGDTYVPRGAEKAMAKHLEKSLPPHMKQYAGAYMQQHVVDPGRGRAVAPAPVADGATPSTPHAPTAHLSADLSAPVTGAEARPEMEHEPATAGPQKSYDGSMPSNPNDLPPDHPYAFILNPEKPAKKPLMTQVPGNNSMITRILIVLGGLLVLLIIFAVFKSVLSGSSNFAPFINIAQDQQELIHLAANAGDQKNLSASSQNFASTMELSLTSSKSQTLKYLVTNHQKVSPKILNLKVSSTIDKQLADAAAATTYNQTFHDIVETKLDGYLNALQQTYAQTTGQKGRALLNDSYSQAQLLKIQLDTTVN